MRTVDVDEQADDLASIVNWLNGHAKNTEPTSELVLDDVVVPFFNRFILPIPVHLTAGIRRRVIDVTDPKQVYSFERDPVQIVIREENQARAAHRVVLLPLDAGVSSSTTASCRRSPSSRPPPAGRIPA